MDLFELSAKIELDDSDYKKSAKEAVKSADAIEDSLEDAGEAAEKVEDSFEDLGDTAQKASKDTEDLGDSVNKSKDSFFGSMLKADLFSDALSKAGEIAGEVASYIWNLDEATEEYRTSQSKLNTAFKVAGFSADTAKKAFQGLYRATGDIDRATEASQLLSQLALSTEQVSTWAEIATGVVGTFGDSLPVESLIESANETARVGKVTGTLADALNWAGQVGEDEFNAMLADCATQAERTNLITETLNGTYADAAKTFEETSGSVLAARDAYLEVQAAAAEAGKSVEGMKNSMEVSARYAKTGFYSAVSDLTEAISGLIGGTKSSSDLYREWIGTMESKIKTGNIEEATAAFQELGRVVQYFEEHPIDSIWQFGGIFSAYGAQQDLNGLLEVAQKRFGEAGYAADGTAEAEERLAAASQAAVEEVEPLILSANGLSIQLEGTGIEAEEAAAKFQTYTDAATDLFGQISTKSELSYQQVVDNLEHNWQATNDFANNMQSLAGTLPQALYETFSAGGPQAYAGIVAMLAEANRGTDEGLTELNRQYKLGGDAALKAFLGSMQQMPEGSKDPAKVVASQMEQDTSVESASIEIISRASASMSEAVDSAGFDSAGTNAMSLFIAGMENMRPNIMAKARELAGAARDEINRALDGIKGSSGRYSAGGLDYVPANGFPAILHKGEAVLTAREADSWRRGDTDNSRSITINQYISAVPQTPAELAAVTEAYMEQAVWRL